MTTASLVLALCLAVFYLLLGAGKIAATSPMRERAAHVGMPVSTYRASALSRSPVPSVS